MSLDIAHLQEQVIFTNQAHIQATPASEVLTKIGDSFQKLNPLNIIKGPRGGLWGTINTNASLCFTSYCLRIQPQINERIH